MDKPDTDGMQALCELMGVGELPPEVADKLKEATEDDIRDLVTSVAIQTSLGLIDIARSAFMRCRCGGQGKTSRICDECHADVAKLKHVAVSLACLARFQQAAEAPGSRINAAREARAEREKPTKD